MDHNGSHPLIGDLHRSGLAILHTRLDGSGVQLVAIRCLQLHDAVPAALSVGNADHTIAVRSVSPKDLTIHLSNFEFDTGDPLPSVFITLHNLQATGRGVVESKGLRIIRIHLNSLGLGSRINYIAIQRLCFLHHQGAGHAADPDLAVCISRIESLAGKVAVGIINETAICIGNLELNASKRLTTHTIAFLDDDSSLLFIPERQGLHLTFLDEDTLRRAIQDIALNSLHLACSHRRSGLKIRNDNAALFIRHIFAITPANSSAGAVCHKESDTFQRFMVCTFNELLDH